MYVCMAYLHAFTKVRQAIAQRGLHVVTETEYDQSDSDTMHRRPNDSLDHIGTPSLSPCKRPEESMRMLNVWC